jgi:OHCU decarboxylase
METIFSIRAFQTGPPKSMFNANQGHAHMTDYPRDMLGHGATPPDSQWPDVDGTGHARIAVQFVVNYEEGGENNILHGDAASEAFLSEIVGAQPWVGQRHWNMESIYEYGARAGFWRLHRMFTTAQIPVTVFGVTTALERSPDQTRAMLDAGWEIASHGLKWVEHKDMSEAEERSQIQDSILRHTAIAGAAPRGWYTGRCSMNTVRLASEAGDFDYIADSYADDLPYWVQISGRQQLIVPYTLDCNDMRFATPQGFNSGDQFYAYLKDTFDTLYAEGHAGQAKMMSIGLHCRLVGRPGRAAALQRFMDYARGHDGVWFATRLDIARHWHAHHPHKKTTPMLEAPVPVLSDLTQPYDLDAFMERFGGVFEHSPWVAARSFAGHPTASNAADLHSSMVASFRAGSDAERLGVLNAHPDLAGKLAAAKRLTADSTAEQASAGLDALTNDERSYFETLNDTYKQSFGFPFIMAVKGKTKAEILNAFEARLQNGMGTERAAAEAEVEKIALLRLKTLFGENE